MAGVLGGKRCFVCDGGRGLCVVCARVPECCFWVCPGASGAGQGAVSRMTLLWLGSATGFVIMVAEHPRTPELPRLILDYCWAAGGLLECRMKLLNSLIRRWERRWEGEERWTRENEETRRDERKRKKGGLNLRGYCR